MGNRGDGTQQREVDAGFNASCTDCGGSYACDRHFMPGDPAARQRLDDAYPERVATREAAKVGTWCESGTWKCGCEPHVPRPADWIDCGNCKYERPPISSSLDGDPTANIEDCARELRIDLDKIERPDVRTKTIIQAMAKWAKNDNAMLRRELDRVRAQAESQARTDQQRIEATEAEMRKLVSAVHAQRERIEEALRER